MHRDLTMQQTFVRWLHAGAVPILFDRCLDAEAEKGRLQLKG